MNDPHSQPDLTAYALGELDHANDDAVHTWLREHPEAQHEVDAVSDLAQAMQAAAPTPSLRLHPAQRHAVLSGPERVREMVATASRRSQITSRPPLVLRLLIGGIKAGLAASVVVAAFIAGKTYQSDLNPVVVADQPRPPVSGELPPAEQITPKPAESTDEPFLRPVVVVHSPVPLAQPPVPPAALPEVKPELPPPLPAPVIATLPENNTEKPTPRTRPEAITRIAASPVVSTTQTPATSFRIAPSETRPRVEGGQGFASLAPKGKVTSEETGKTKAPTLLIHSWRAEVTDAPWEAGKKLVRISLQIPGEQAAAASGQQYALQVNFHPTHVRSYRLLGQRATPAAEKDGAASFSAWYELTTNGVPTSTARTIGNVTLSNARFTVTALAPFDGERLQIVDQGQPWDHAADDYLFETAVLGWGVLLNGRDLPAGLNHSSILELAERALKISDRHGERARFVKLLRDAARAAGS